MKNKYHWIKFLAKSFHYAQGHVDCSEAWDDENRWDYFTCVDYQGACFLAQNTIEGHNGVECNVFLDQLIDRPMKSEEEWEKIILEVVEELGGLKK